MKRLTLLLLFVLPLPLLAEEVPPHIARGHLLAAFCEAAPEKKPKQVMGIYRQIIPAAAPHSSYTTVAFNGGYVGLAGNKDGKRGTTINFSIWGKDAEEVEPADKRHGTIKTRQFTHEGTGWAGRLAYPWEVGKRYQIYVHVKHEEGDTIYSAWFGDADKEEWLLAGRTRKQGIHHLAKAGGFLEHAGTKNMETPRSTGYGPAWVHDGAQWLPCTQYKMQLKDPDNARFYRQDHVAYLVIGLGETSGQGAKHTFVLPSPGPRPPALPEEVALLR